MVTLLSEGSGILRPPCLIVLQISINDSGQPGRLHEACRLYAHSLKPTPADRHCCLMNSNRLLLTEGTSAFQGTNIPRPFDSRATVPVGPAPFGVWTNAVALMRIVRSYSH